MGWTTCSLATEWKYVGGRRVVDRQKECDRLLNQKLYDSHGSMNREDWTVVGSMRVLKSAMVGSTYYAAVETKKYRQAPYVWAAVFLTCGKGTDGTIWGYKDMDESMGPNEDKCPASILALLTPTDSKYANEWRERCRRNIQIKAEERKNGPKTLYAPTGVDISVRDKSWIITSRDYRASHSFSGVRFSKRKFHSSDTAMMCFLYNFGTDAQKKEFAMSGRECPVEWKGVAA